MTADRIAATIEDAVRRLDWIATTSDGAEIAWIADELNELVLALHREQFAAALESKVTA